MGKELRCAVCVSPHSNICTEADVVGCVQVNREGRPRSAAACSSCQPKKVNRHAHGGTAMHLCVVGYTLTEPHALVQGPWRSRGRVAKAGRASQAAGTLAGQVLRWNV